MYDGHHFKSRTFLVEVNSANRKEYEMSMNVKSNLNIMILHFSSVKLIFSTMKST